MTALVLTAAACGTPAASSASTDVALTQVSRLASGTLGLEATDQAVSDSMARQLLPLWQLLAELRTNSAAAPEETAAVVEQIEDTMTDGQLLAIEEMELSGSDLPHASQVGSKPEVQSGAIRDGAPVMDRMPPDAGAGIPPGAESPGGQALASSSATDATADSIGSEPDGSLTLITQVISLLEGKASR